MFAVQHVSVMQEILGFIGAGQMATALAKGVVAAGLYRAEQIRAFDPFDGARANFAELFGATTVVESNAAVASQATLLVLAVKPQQMSAALAEVAPALTPNAVVVSIAAGVTLEKLAAQLPPGSRVVRVMPNTPCLVGQGASCFALGQHADSADGESVRRLLSAVGIAHEVPEKLLDAVTGLSGSGPAFVYTVIEALADGGVRAGLPRALAAELAAQTVAGAAAMVLETGKHPAELRDAVASPAGTTIAGLAELERLGLRGALIEAVTAAAERSAELGRK
jgi:pyrroline-5-carboxylate reductase